MGFWIWFKASQTPTKKKHRRRDDGIVFASSSPLMALDPFVGVVAIGAHVVGSIGDAIAKRKRRKKREKHKLPVARARR